MKKEERLPLYEKLYFFEMERREKINARLSLPFAAVVAIAGLQSYLLNSAAQIQSVFFEVFFWLLFSFSLLLTIYGAWFFRKAWYGFSDKFLNVADTIESHYEKIRETYADYEESDRLVKDAFQNFLFDRLVQSSSWNSRNNDNRSECLYRANVGLTLAAVLALACAIPLHIDKQSANEASMSDKKPTQPPPPPPPPPERLVKTEIPRTPPKKPEKSTD